MAIKDVIAQYDWVEFLESVEDAPAGARGGLLDFLGSELALVEVMEPCPEGVPIVTVPLSKLRGLGPERPPART
jgi:hypothetical protein